MAWPVMRGMQVLISLSLVLTCKAMDAVANPVEGNEAAVNEMKCTIEMCEDSINKNRLEILDSIQTTPDKLELDCSSQFNLDKNFISGLHKSVIEFHDNEPVYCTCCGQRLHSEHSRAKRPIAVRLTENTGYFHFLCFIRPRLHRNALQPPSATYKAIIKFICECTRLAIRSRSVHLSERTDNHRSEACIADEEDNASNIRSQPKHSHQRSSLSMSSIELPTQPTAEPTNNIAIKLLVFANQSEEAFLAIEHEAITQLFSALYLADSLQALNSDPEIQELSLREKAWLFKHVPVQAWPSRVPKKALTLSLDQLVNTYLLKTDQPSNSRVSLRNERVKNNIEKIACNQATPSISLARAVGSALFREICGKKQPEKAIPFLSRDETANLVLKRYPLFYAALLIELADMCYVNVERRVDIERCIFAVLRTVENTYLGAVWVTAIIDALTTLRFSILSEMGPLLPMPPLSYFEQIFVNVLASGGPIQAVEHAMGFLVRAAHSGRLKGSISAFKSAILRVAPAFPLKTLKALEIALTEGVLHSPDAILMMHGPVSLISRGLRSSILERERPRAASESSTASYFIN